MVRVDQPWQDDVPVEVEHFIGGLGKLAGFSDLFDEAIANKKTTIGNLPLMVIHGEHIGVFNE